ncbi:hypothetical protein R3P38DRAFT_2837345 [Favolaschia claudopus]|uniref:SnoaL-like domain-containing protein n=1 Tax=Favolaschia claudopus TaxID=2862362 RepID=A0AAW0E330_9AGAR
MASYTVNDYLLDRVQVEETLHKLLWFVDRKEWDKISTVFADKIIVDYTDLLGGEPAHTTGVDQGKVWEGMLEYVDATQHNATSIILDLPSPTANVQRPTEVTLTCNVFASHVRKEVLAGSMLQNGGRYQMKIIRTDDKSGNPWRISVMKAFGIFYTGNTGITKNPETGIAWM